METVETDSRGEGSIELSEFNFICIREYVAEVRKRDWEKCCPFKLSGNSEADQVLASLVLEDDNALVNSIHGDTEALVDRISEDVEAPNFLTASQEGNAEVHEARSEIPTDNIIADDAADGIINGGISAAASRRVNDAQRQNETNITEDAIVADNAKPQDPVINDNAKPQDAPSDSAAGKMKDAIRQKEKISAADAIAAEIDGQQDTVVGNDPVNSFGDGSSRLVSNEGMNNAAAQSQNENRVSDEDVITSGNDGIQNDDGANAMIDGSSEPTALEVRDAQNERNITEDSMAPGKDKRVRILSKRKTPKVRKLADIYQELGSCIYGGEGPDDCEYTSDDTSEDDDSDEVTLDSYIKGKRYVNANSKRIEALNTKRKAAQVSEPKLERMKRFKSVSEDNRQNNSELGSSYYLRNRINELDLQKTNKRKEFSPEDSHLSRGDKSNREAVQEDGAREVLKILDGNQGHFTEEENHSRPSHGLKRAQHLVDQPPMDISINNVVERASGCVQKRIRERSPPTDSESMAIMQLLRLSKAGVNTETPSKAATEDPTLSVAKHKIPSGLDGVVPPALGSMVSKPCVEVNVNDGVGLPHAVQTKSVIFICPMSRNPAKFSIPKAKKFMRRGKEVKTV